MIHITSAVHLLIAFFLMPVATVVTVFKDVCPLFIILPMLPSKNLGHRFSGLMSDPKSLYGNLFVFCDLKSSNLLNDYFTETVHYFEFNFNVTDGVLCLQISLRTQ